MMRSSSSEDFLPNLGRSDPAAPFGPRQAGVSGGSLKNAILF